MKRELEVVSEERPEGVTSHSIGAPLDGERLDRVVSMLWDCSRSEASTLIADGEVRLDGEDVYNPELKATHTRKRVGMVFQKPNPFPSMSIRDNVLSGLRLDRSCAATAPGRPRTRRR